MAGGMIKFTGKIFILPAMKLFLQKQAVIITTITKYIYNVFNLSCWWIFPQFSLLIIVFQHYSIIESHFLKHLIGSEKYNNF